MFWKDRNFKKKINRYNDEISSANFFAAIPILKRCGYDQNTISEILKLPFIRVQEGRFILMNEKGPSYTNFRSILMTLDNLPTSVLMDLNRLDLERFKKRELGTKPANEKIDECYRWFYFMLLPEILWAREGVEVESAFNWDVLK